MIIIIVATKALYPVEANDASKLRSAHVRIAQ